MLDSRRLGFSILLLVTVLLEGLGAVVSAQPSASAPGEPRLATRISERIDLLTETARELRLSDSARALTSAETAKDLLEEHPDPNRELTLTLTLADLYRLADRDRDALREARHAVRLARSVGDRAALAAALHDLGKARRTFADHAEALQALDEAIALYRELGDARQLAHALRDSGVVLRRMGDLSSALERYFSALELFEELGLQKSQAGTLNNIGIVYRRLERHEEALEIYERALAIRDRLGSDGARARLLNNIGVVHLETGDFDRALEHFEDSIAIKERQADQLGLSTTLSNLGLCYFELGRLNEAMEHYEHALARYEGIESQYALSELLVRMGRAQRRLGRTHNARATLERAIAKAEANGEREELRDAWNELAELEAGEGRYKEAYTASRAYDRIRGELLDRQSRDKLAELEARYSAEESERRIAILEQEQAIGELHRKRLEIVLRVLVTAGLLALLVVVLWISRLRLKARAAEVRARQHERERYISELEAKNAEMERFTYTVSHDLKSPLVTIRNFLGLIEQDALSGDLDRLRHDLGRVDQAAGTMARILDELLQLSRIGRVVGTSEEIDLGELVAAVAEHLSGLLTESGAELKVADGLPRAFADRARLFEVFQNLIENAVSHGGPGPRIEVGWRREKDSFVVFVRDHGPGIEPRYQKKVFGLFERLDPSTEGTGIGLALVKRIIEVQEGRIWIESRGEGDGATFCFTLPWLVTEPPGGRGRHLIR